MKTPPPVFPPPPPGPPLPPPVAPPAGRAARAEATFNAALARPPADRNAFLSAACEGDDDLRAYVEALLAAHREAGDFMNQGPLAPEVEAELARLKPEEEGERIGRYKLLQEIGEGGFGTVWMAEQMEPVTRRVALKIIKLGMDTRDVVARFEAERQALAMMDHPNIAKVFDAGATDRGRPFFVMELVKGVPVTQYCDEAGLGTRERLELFGDVCAAIQHAHQKGVIHRDIKPSNVMVTLHGDKAVVKVIDFGIAKATQGKLTDKTLFTRFEQLIGTPVYMSPEQASLSGLDVDTRSDIYALGVLLYELLTGKPPFDGTSLLSAGYEEMRRIIREVEPPKPSSRVGTLAGVERTLFAKARHIEPGKAGRLIEPDLDWIVMKAIEKDRSRRYETANGLALDIRRFLADEPVAAGPPSVTYRVRKFARRNRRALLSGAAAAMALLVGLAAAGGIWLDATFEKNERVARALDLIGQAERCLERDAAAEFDDDGPFLEARKLEQRVAESLSGLKHVDEATRERRERLRQGVAAEERNRKLVTAIEEVMVNDISSMGSARPHAQAKARTLAMAFADFGITPFDGQVADTVDRMTTGREPLQDRMLAGLAAWSAALEAINPEQSERLEEIIDRADTDPWRRELRQAIKSGDAAALEALAERTEISEQPTMTVLELSTALDEKKLAGAVEKLLRRAQREAPASFWTNFSLGQTLATTIGRDEGGDVSEKILVVGVADFGKSLPGLLQDPNPVRTEFNDAVGFLRAAVAARPDVLGAWLVLGVSLNASGHLDEAIATYREAASRFPDGDRLDQLLGQALLGQSRHEEALPHLRRAAERDPAVEWLQFLLGMTLAELGEYEEARTAFLEAVRLASEEAHATGETEEARERRTSRKINFLGKEREFNEELAYLTLAMAQSGRGDSEEALASSQLALEANPKSAAAHLLLGMERIKTGEWRAAELSIRKSLELDPELAAAHNFFGMVLMSRSDFNGSVVSFRRAITLDPKDATAHSNLGASLRQLGKIQEAHGSLETALNLAPEYGMGWNNFGNVLEAQGKLEKAMECYQKAISFDPTNPMARSNIARMLWITGKHEESIAAYRQLNDAEAYTKFAAVLTWEEKIEEAIDALQRAIALNPDLVAAQHDLGLLSLRAGRYKEAIEPLRTSIRLAPELASAHNGLGLALLFQNEYEEAIDSILKALMLEEDSEPFRNALLAALLSSGRIPAAGVAHGNCGDAGCAIAFLIEKDQQLREIIGKDGAGAAGIPALLGEIYDKFSGSTFGMAEHPAYTDAELRAAWDGRREEIAKRLGSANVRLIQIRKPSDKHPGANQEELRTIAADILQKLDEGGDFAEFAEKHSDGWAGGKPEAVTFGDLPEHLNAAAFSLEEGGFTPSLIEDEHALYLLKVESRQADKGEDFDDPKVRGAIKAALGEQRRREWEQRYLTRVLDPASDLVMARVQNMAGQRLMTAGEYGRAADFFEQALAVHLEKLGPEEPKTLWTMGNLAVVYGFTGRPDEALKIQEEALPIFLKLHGREHPDTLLAMNNLAGSYYNAHRLDEALKLREEVLPIVLKLYGPEHPDTLSTRLNLAGSYFADGRWEEAIKIGEEVLGLYRMVLGPEHRDTIRSRHDLAVFYQKAGRREEALELRKEALEISRKVLGAEHPNTHLAMKALANSYLTTGRTEDALTLFVEAFTAKPGDTFLAMKLAALQAWFGRNADHAATSSRMLEWAKESTNQDDLERVTRLACLRPIADAETQDAALLLARKVLDLRKEGQPSSPWDHLALGMAEYRSGHHQEADATLNAVPVWLAADPQDIGIIEGTANFYRAMSLYQQGEEDDARALFTATEAKMKPLPADEENPFAAEEPDPDDLILWLACKEARALLYPK